MERVYEIHKQVRVCCLYVLPSLDREAEFLACQSPSCTATAKIHTSGTVYTHEVKEVRQTLGRAGPLSAKKNTSGGLYYYTTCTRPNPRSTLFGAFQKINHMCKPSFYFPHMKNHTKRVPWKKGSERHGRRKVTMADGVC
jgi:hypothetical protein